MKKRVLTVFTALACLASATCSVYAAEEKKETRTVVDHAGNEVELPDEIDRIAIVGLTPLASVYCMLTGSTDKLVGIDSYTQNAAVHSIMNRAFPELGELPTSFIEEDVINTEELLKLGPDLVFTHAAIPDQYEACEAAGIPCVQVSPNLFADEDYNVIKTLNAWVELLAEVLEIDNTASEMIAYGEQVENSVREKASTIPEEDRVNVLVLANYNDNTITAAGQSFSKYWCETVGGNYMTDDIAGFTAELDMESIYVMNPDVIYLSSFSAYTLEDFYNNTAGEGQDWSSVKAVQDKRVYKFPLGTYYWYPPSSDAPLSLMWMASTMYPEVYNEIDLDQEIRDYYEKYYGIEVTDEELLNIYFPSEESAANW